MSSWWHARSRPETQPRRRALEHVVLGALPLALTLWLAVSAIRFHWVAEDFSLAYYPAAHRLLDGGNPYAVSHGQILSGAAFVYPALSAVVLAPFALVASGLADHLYTLLCLALVPGTLWTAGVRDWRVYGITLLWFPMIIGWQGENVSVPAMFMVALMWRFRERPVVAGLIVAAAISIKPFAWPLCLWLLATRRVRAAAWAVLAGVILNGVAWGLVGFKEITVYLHLAREDTNALWRGGYGAPAIGGHLGLGLGLGELVAVLAAVLLATVVVNEGFVKGRQREALVLSVALMLVASPLVWIHYFVLLLVPLAIARPRWDWVWAAPVVMWLLPSATSVNGWQLALAWTVAAVCFAAALRATSAAPQQPDRPSRAEPASSLIPAR